MRKILALLLFVGVLFGAEKEVSIGSKMHTEAQILTELSAMLLEDAGFRVERAGNLQSLIARKASLKKQFDMYYEYTGTGYALYLKGKDKELMRDGKRLYGYVKREDKKRGLVWLDPLNINNTYTIMMRVSEAKELGINSISDLAGYVKKHPKELVLGVNPEFWERPDGMKALMKEYGFRIPRSNVKIMDAGLMYISLKQDRVDIAMGYSTDGRIKAYELQNLKDDKNFFPVYNPSLVVNTETFEKYPKIQKILTPMWKKLDEKMIMELNYRVDGQEKSVKEVAKNWLKQEGLI